MIFMATSRIYIIARQIDLARISRYFRKQGRTGSPVQCAACAVFCAPLVPEMARHVLPKFLLGHFAWQEQPHVKLGRMAPSHGHAVGIGERTTLAPFHHHFGGGWDRRKHAGP